jgi:phospholipid/cholesterol/gamma-HCH transport system ATP-binding protein
VNATAPASNEAAIRAVGGGADEPAIKVCGLEARFGPRTILQNLDLEVRRGEVMGVVGGSGSGKSVLLRTIVGLNRPTAGTIEILGETPAALDAAARRRLDTRIGVLFQDGALFSSLTVAQNVQVPLRENLDLPDLLIEDITRLKLALVGLAPDAAQKYPSELSGGMRKRAGLARALVLDPELIFLDEPTAGLDPISAAEFDALICALQHSLGFTVLMVTHDLDSLYAICNRIAVLVDMRTRVGTLEELLRDQHPWIHAYFHGPRGREAQVAAHRDATATTETA